MMLGVLLSRADVVNVFGGTYASWPSVWTSLGLDDGDDGIATTSLEIRGDATHPAAAHAQDNNYICFRVQLEAATFNTATVNGSYLVYVDHVGSGNENGRPDFAFAWDAMSNNNNTHGLEMTEYDTAGTTWGSLYMDDVDGSNSSKGTADINGVSGTERPGDGYLRVLRDQPGVNGANANSYVEVAVSWNYLENNSTTGLGKGQDWRIAFGNIANATDHGAINQNGDVAGGINYDGLLTSGWSAGISTVPEIPASPWLVLGFLGLVAASGRLRVGLGRWRQSSIE